ncbi:MAG: prepilin-type N-terminal cleavage/methylation domain-containing protein [Bacilli bacterium]|nr:prepilin-type N-terminal cleavage/methylation domain-containing protein [Bacilli bacterium]
MKKNRKGFTLIELLAAIVLLGILAGVTIPIIINMLDTSKNRMYVNDAKKLITQVEYKIKANNSTMDKPDEGDCIVVSMNYLDTSEFDNSPNGGTYDKDKSFVVVKNKNGKLEYSVSIVEKFKNGGYKGIELVLSDELESGKGNKHVVSFKDEDLINVGQDITKEYINKKLGNNYISQENKILVIYSNIE